MLFCCRQGRRRAWRAMLFCCRQGRRRGHVLQRFDHPSHAAAGRALHHHHIAGLHRLGHQCGGLVGIGGVRGTPVVGQDIVHVAHQGTGGEHQVDARLHRRFGQAGMQGAGVGSQFQHVAQHRQAASARRRHRGGQAGQGGPHRGRAGVVGFVDDDDLPIAPREGLAGAAAFRSDHPGQRWGGILERHADGSGRQQHGQAIARPLAAGNTDPVVQRLIAEQGEDQGGVVLDGEIQQAPIGFDRGAEALAIDNPGCLRRGQQQRIMGVVARQDRGAAGFDAQKDLGLGFGDGGGRGEEFHMHRFHRGDDGDMRADQPGQGRDLARMVHPQFEHAEAACRRHPRQRQGNAPVVVEAAGAGMGRTGRLEGQLEHFLGAGLADAAGHRDDAGGRSGPGRGAERA